jgi:hypothetical protein
MTIPPSPSPSEAPPSTSAPAEPGGLGDRTPVRPEQTLPTANDQVWDIVSAGARTRHARPTHPDRRPARPSLPATSLGVSSFVREFVRLRYRDPRPHPSSARPKISCGGWGGGGGGARGATSSIGAPRTKDDRTGHRPSSSPYITSSSVVFLSLRLFLTRVPTKFKEGEQGSFSLQHNIINSTASIYGAEFGSWKLAVGS